MARGCSNCKVEIGFAHDGTDLIYECVRVTMCRTCSEDVINSAVQENSYDGFAADPFESSLHKHSVDPVWPTIKSKPKKGPFKAKPKGPSKPKKK